MNKTFSQNFFTKRRKNTIFLSKTCYLSKKKLMQKLFMRLNNSSLNRIMHAVKTKKIALFPAFITTLTAVEASATEGRPKSEQ